MEEVYVEARIPNKSKEPENFDNAKIKMLNITGIFKDFERKLGLFQAG